MSRRSGSLIRSTASIALSRALLTSELSEMASRNATASPSATQVSVIPSAEQRCAPWVRIASSTGLPVSMCWSYSWTLASSWLR